MNISTMPVGQLAEGDWFHFGSKAHGQPIHLHRTSIVHPGDGTVISVRGHRLDGAWVHCQVSYGVPVVKVATP